MSSKTSSARQQQIPALFKGSSYKFWSIKMKTLLKSEGLWDFVETGYPQKSDQKNYEKQDAKALFFIQQAVDESVFSKIVDATTAKEAWSLLKNIYQESKSRSPEEIMYNFVHECVCECLKLEIPSTKELPVASIYTVPRTGHRDLSESCFKPRIVSIGPLHREDENLQQNDGEKATHAWYLLHRTNEHEQYKVLKTCAQKVTASIDRIRSCYAEKVIYTDIELAKMMVIDGCFVLEFLYLLASDKPTEFGNSLFFELAFYDILLLENQIPFFVLEDIFQCTIFKFDQISLIEIIHEFIKLANPFQNLELSISSYTKSSLHILGIMQQCYSYHNATPKSFPDITLPSVVELDRARVNFKPIIDITEAPLGMFVKSRRLPCSSFIWGGPTLIMPVLAIDDFTRLVLKNLIAYEQVSGNVTQHVTSYAMIMDMLVNTQEDVSQMVESKILSNLTGSNQDAADMINGLCIEVFGRDCFYNKQIEELDKHFNGSWTKYIVYWSKSIKWLRSTYFNNLWTIIGLLGGISLFVLTVIQTIYAVKSDKGNK